MLAMDEMTMCNLNVVTCSDKLTENHHQLCSFPQLYGAFSFSSFGIWFN